MEENTSSMLGTSWASNNLRPSDDYNAYFIFEGTSSEKLKSLLKVTELVSELKFKHYSGLLFPLHPSDHQAPGGGQHPFTPQHPRAHRPVRT